MRERNRTVLCFVVTLTVVAQLAVEVLSHDAVEEEEAAETTSHDAETLSSVRENASAEKTFDDKIILQELQRIRRELKSELTDAISAARVPSEDNHDDLGSLLLDQDELFAREDINGGLLATSIDTGATHSLLENTTLLDKMKGILKYEDLFSDISLLDSFDWFGEEDFPPSKSRQRRTSEPYRYRRYQQPLRGYVPENSPVGTSVVEIPRNFDGKLEIVDPVKPAFRLNSKTAVLETMELLDYEKRQVYTLIVSDSANEGSAFYSHDVIVYVTDVNDNIPKFNMKSYIGSVNQRSRVGSPVIQLNASDPDGGLRGQIGFLIDDRNTPFTVNPKSWVLETNGKPLDQSVFDNPVHVRTFDQGYPRKESQPVVISVNKANNPPKFSETAYSIAFSEKVLPGVIIGRLIAKSLSNIPIGYHILPTSDVYAINARGELSLKRSVSYENSVSLRTSVVTVEASELTDDNPLSSRVSVTLVITNDNENPTTFTEAVYNVQIDEDVSPGSFVTTVSVTDCDCAANCQCTGTQIDFALIGDVGYFVVNKAGEIQTVQSFDYQIKNLFEFMVTAQDHLGNEDDQRPARAYVRVRLRDVNNHAPKFTEARYEFIIDEDSDVGHLVGVVQAIDNDVIGPPLTYTIKSISPKNGAFAITDQRFGIVTVASSLKLVNESMFTLMIEASDGVLRSLTTAEVIVADVNDNAPHFTTCPDTANIEENLSVGARVTVLKAEDKDRGVNARIEYFIESSHDLFSNQHVELFKVNNETGELQTADVLDRETKSNYFIIVSAKDQSKNSDVRQVGYCQFLINVEDENDNYPFFEVARYETSVMHDLALGTSVLKVKASDDDVGLNAEVMYSIDGGDPLFQVNSAGWVTVKASLLGKLGRKTLMITATNTSTRPYKGQGSPDETQKTTVEIVVTKGKLPSFTQLVYQANVKENALVGTIVFNISATPTSSFAGLIYYLGNLRHISNIQFPFNVDHSTGLVQLASGLDFEHRQVYVFPVNVQEIGVLGLVETSLEINVVDVNDIAPIFGRASYDATVSEDALVGSTVIRIKARDVDPQNAQIFYEIENSGDSHLFSLKNHLNAIEIITNATFDREDREHYHVVVVAKDNGNPVLSSHSFVTVRVLDENDSPPVFDSAHYEVSVAENTKVGQVVETVITRDRDYGRNALALFFIAAGNDGRFRMTSEQLTNASRGLLVIAKPLDYEVRSEYKLTVIASDDKFSAVTIITVKITDADDDPPYFPKSLYNTSVPENTLSGTKILVVEATDNDSPTSSLVYSLDNAASPYFIIASSTGSITTSTTLLDREKMPVVIFSVTVSDGLNKARTFVEVTVLDVNEPPYFPNKPYTGYVKENQPQGTPVRYVVAFDGDDPKLNDGKNSNITYTIDRNSGQPEIDSDGEMFTIDPDTGLLLTKSVFNLEKIRRNPTIHVRATDGGSPSLYDVVLVTIVIEDVSEFPPKFTASLYSEEVAENAMLGQHVLKLTVEDEDFTAVGHQFSITSGNYPFAFYMQPQSGEIIVAGILNYESKNEYNLTVSVSERNISKMFKSDYTSVFIRILDSNDKPPVFKPKTYYKKIPEDVVLGTEVLVVTCSDGDVGPNAVPTFYITSGNIDDSFEVMTHPDDKNFGVVRVSGLLDRERKPSYTLEVTATDVGGLTDNATVVVELADVNDSPPKFTPSYYEGSISGGVRKEQPVVTISVTDSDQVPNGAPFTFTLKNFQDKFQLKNPNGPTVELCTRLIEFMRETSPLYKVIVNAVDGGSPSQSADAVVFVNVVDSQANKEPFDGSMMIIVYALNGRFQGGSIGYVYYQDNDYGVDNNEYSVLSQGPGSYFTVDSMTGRIQSLSNIPNGGYTLNVTVREKSRSSGPNIGKTVSSKVRIRVISVNETAVQHAVALRFPLRNSELFVNILYMKLVDTLAEILAVSPDVVYVFSIGNSSGGVADSPYGVDVWIAIGMSDGGFMNPTYLFSLLEMNYGKLSALGATKLEVGLDKCASESKSVGVCKNILTAQNSSTVISGYYGQVAAPNSSLTVVGIDTELRDTYEVLPEPATDCRSMPCKNGGTCHDVVPQGYVCECPLDFRGPECQLTTRTFKRPESYIWLEPMAAYELSSVSFEFMSETSIGNGLLLYQGSVQQDISIGIHDFLAVSLVSGFITVVISLGGRPASFDLRQGDRLDDGMWHHVELKRFKKEIRLIVDHCESAVTTQQESRFFEDRISCEVINHSFENFIYLNSLGPLQVGGSSISSFPVSTITTQSFYGCIRNIHDNGKMYDLRYPIKEVNAPTGCDQGCNHPCKNGGYCEGEDSSSLSCCTCVAGYTGCDCSERSSSLWYLNNSFSEYNINDLAQSTTGRQRRHLYSITPRSSPKFHTNFLIRLRVNLDLRDAILFYSSTTSGNMFSELGIKSKMLYYTFKFADEMKTITLTGASIADKKWHNVHVNQQGNTASLQLDYKAKAYGTTGGIIRLVDFSGGKMYTGGMPQLVSKDSKLEVTKSLGSLSDNRKVAKVDGDFQGCTSGTVYNGKQLDKAFVFDRFHVINGCPCTAVIDCKNNGTCADEEPPYCLCPEGFTGETCEEVVVLPSTGFSRHSFGPGMRSAGRHRMLDPVWICVFLMSLIVLICLLCLFHTLPVIDSERPLIEEDAHDSIMAYQEHGVEEVDSTGYDITLLMKHSRQRVIHKQVTSSTSAVVQGSFEQTGGDSMDFVDSGKRDRLESWVMERMSEADRDLALFLEDEMREIRDEGKYSDIDDLSELEMEHDNYGDVDVFAVDWDNIVK